MIHGKEKPEAFACEQKASGYYLQLILFLNQ